MIIRFPSQYGFRKGNTTQHWLLVLIEKSKEAIDTGALLTDVSKTFECLDHSLLLAKLHWYESLKPIFSYFSNRTHSTKIKECFSNRLKIEYGVTLGSILGPLLFNINSADDTTPYACTSDINTVILNYK